LIVCDTATPLLLLAIVLYVLGLLGGAYVDTPLGIHMGFNTRNGPFFGLIFYVSGYRLSRQQPRATWFFNGLALLLGGYGLQFLELAFLQHQFASTLAQDYVAGTYFVGLGSAMMALSNHAFLRLPGLRAMGPLVLGIYAIHVAFIELLYPVRYFNASPLWDIGFVLLVFALSFLSASLLARTAFGRRMTA
jgi:surface polysaccharide O-acyltransferase-like enzyme